ncbi:hypothetical protein C8R43DRAFT_1136439 [Mycena crocata]|nr:hypothetical protein C8R43DRAFT_1136439 [Mycena crocata]
MSGLAGSSVTKPWQLNEDGGLVLASSPPRPVEPPPSRQPARSTLNRGIIRGPPSVILQPPRRDPRTQAEREAITNPHSRLEPRAHTGSDTTTTRRLQQRRERGAGATHQENERERGAVGNRAPVSILEVYGFAQRNPLPANPASGSRSRQNPPQRAALPSGWSDSELYLTDARPPYMEKVKDHQQCSRGGGTRPPPPTMFVHQPHTSEVVTISADGRRANVSSTVVDTGPDIPAYYQDDAGTNAALEAEDFSYDLGDNSMVPEVPDPVDDGIKLKPKRNENSDFPFRTWVRDYRSSYLDEVLRLEGRGGEENHGECGGCGEAAARFRCEHQMCYGPGMFCQRCIVLRHQVLPLHWIQEWTGTFFGRTSLAVLGLEIQTGHPPGFACETSTRGHHQFVVLDVTGVHTINLFFCELSAHDFLRSLELLTNNDGLSPVPDRRHAFRHIVRQWRDILRLKRAGRGHYPNGIATTAQGELALACRACPHAGRNLPAGWNNINWAAMPEDLRYKYFLFLAQDCNFRLINRDVSSTEKDPIVGDGLGYFVNNGRYAQFLRAYVTEEEISTCSGFQAMFLANQKRVKGLRTTGVGGVTCARHNMWRGNGIGDLQRGERYCNMDFILASALFGAIIFYLILSYDIACQYGKLFWSRMKKLPQGMQPDVPEANIWFKVPNFHLPPHKPACHSPFSFHWMWGAGRTHGETVEQNWEFTNGAAASTKMMGVGARHSTLEDLFGFHNWRRLVAWRRIFVSRMAENVKEGQVHRDAFEAFDAALRDQDAEMVNKWQRWVEDWESRQHTDNAESPFEVAQKVMSMKDIRVKLAKEELILNGDGGLVEREDTPSTFLLMGLEIEESQRHLAIDVKAQTTPTDLQAVDFLKRRTTITRRIRAFRKLQRTYMPNVRRFLTQGQRALWDGEADREAETMRLFLPSDIGDKKMRAKGCAEGLADCEAQLREAEAREALVKLREGLSIRTMTNRNALYRLQGHGPWERELQVLEEKDVRALNERALTEEETAQRQAVHDLRDVEEGGFASYGVVALGESRQTLSWIWYSGCKDKPTEKELIEALRVEWCKAYARMRRWHEDVVLTEEEMHRTLEYGHWAAAEWLSREELRDGAVDAVLQEGLVAYAREQADREVRTIQDLEGKWAGIREKGRAYLAKETLAGGDVVVLLGEDDDKGDEEEGAPDYEDEGDDELLE